MEKMFEGDSYESPARRPLPFIHYLMLGSRWGMYLTFIRDIVLKYRKEVIDGKYTDEQWVKSSWESLKIVERFGAQVSISGMDNIKEGDGPYVYIANHMSTLETAVLPCIIQPHMPVTFVVKESLTKGKIFGYIMRSRDPIAVKRENAREDLTTVLTEGVDRLKKGISVIIFPQATRNPEFDESKFNTLGIKLALRAGVKVVPIALKTDFWGEGKIIRGFGSIRRNEKVHFEIGEPIKPEGRGKNEHQQIVNFIKDRLKKWGARLAE